MVIYRPKRSLVLLLAVLTALSLFPSMGRAAAPVLPHKVILVAGLASKPATPADWCKAGNDGCMDQSVSRSKDVTFSQVKQYLKSLGIPGISGDQDFLAFSYSPNWRQQDWYYKFDTHQSIYVSAQLFRDQLVLWRQRYGPTMQFDIVAHSLGGAVIAMWAATETDAGLLYSIHSVTATDSPIGGLNEQLPSYTDELYKRCSSPCQVAFDLANQQNKTLMSIGLQTLPSIGIANLRDELIREQTVSCVSFTIYDPMPTSVLERWLSADMGCEQGDEACHSTVNRNAGALNLIGQGVYFNSKRWLSHQADPDKSVLQGPGADIAVPIGGTTRYRLTVVSRTALPLGNRKVELRSNRNQAGKTVDTVTSDPPLGFTRSDGTIDFYIRSTVPGTATLQAYDVALYELAVGQSVRLSFLGPTPTFTPTPISPQPTPIVGDSTPFVQFIGGEGAIRGADFKFSIGRRASGRTEGWLVHSPTGQCCFASTVLTSVEVHGGAASVGGKATAPRSDRAYPFDLLVSERRYAFTVYQDSGSIFFAQEGDLTGGAIRVLETPSGPTAPQPTPVVPQPIPTPTGPVSYVQYVGGEGAIAGADFRFSIGRHAAGGMEGWAVHSPAGRCCFESRSLSSVEVHGGAASVWGYGTWVGSSALLPYNLSVTAQSYHLMVFGGPSQSLNQEGPLIGGSVRLFGPP